MATTQSTPGQIEFLIKKYPGGRFSGLLDGGIGVGDELSLTGPYGTSTLKDGHVLPVVCVAGGAGMAPILSILRHLSETASSRPVRFYYGARTAADLFYLDEITEIGSGLSGFRVRGLPVGVDGRRTARHGDRRRGQRHRHRRAARGRHRQDRGLPVRPAADGRRRPGPARSKQRAARTRSSTTSSPAPSSTDPPKRLQPKEKQEG